MPGCGIGRAPGGRIPLFGAHCGGVGASGYRFLNSAQLITSPVAGSMTSPVPPPSIGAPFPNLSIDAVSRSMAATSASLPELQVQVPLPEAVEGNRPKPNAGTLPKVKCAPGTQVEPVVWKDEKPTATPVTAKGMPKVPVFAAPCLPQQPFPNANAGAADPTARINAAAQPMIERIEHPGQKIGLTAQATTMPPACRP